MSTGDFDSREFRDVLGSFVTGVTVITTLDLDGEPHGLTANSFSSVSLDPPLILWSQSIKSPSHPVFQQAERFCVSILADDQVHVSNKFARPGPKFEGIRTRTGIGGIPLIDDCSATLECTKVMSYPGGDHTVFIGRVEKVSRTPRRPLAFGGGKYLVAQPHVLGPPPASAAAPGIARLHAVRIATQAIVELSDELDETIGLGVWGNKGPTIVRWEEATRPVSENLQTGLVLPVLKSSTGLAFASHLPTQTTMLALEQEFAFDKLPPEAAEATLQEMQPSLDAIRRDGLVRLEATSNFTLLYGGQINATSVPVFDRDGQMVLALTAIGHVERLSLVDDSRVVVGLRAAAATLSRALGHTTTEHP